MALFSDGPAITPEQLDVLHSALQGVLRSVAIDVSAKIDLAQALVADDLIRLWEQHRLGWGVDKPWQILQHIRMDNAIRRWVGFTAIGLIYRDAFASQGNTTYDTQSRQWLASADQERRKVYERGAGIVSNPVRRASALSSEVVGDSGDSSPLYLQATWVDRAGREGAPGPMVSLFAPQGSAWRIPSPTNGDTDWGWHLYAGDSETDLRRQTAIPIPAGQGWSSDQGAVVQDIPPGDGQTADYYVRRRQQLWRG